MYLHKICLFPKKMLRERYAAVLLKSAIAFIGLLCLALLMGRKQLS